MDMGDLVRENCSSIYNHYVWQITSRNFEIDTIDASLIGDVVYIDAMTD